MCDGIEIHFDEKRAHLELDYAPGAFAPYREIARKQLAEFPDIPIDNVIEMSITDTAAFVARRDAPRRRMWDWILGGVFVLIIVFAVIGVFVVVRKIAT